MISLDRSPYIARDHPAWLKNKMMRLIAEFWQQTWNSCSGFNWQQLVVRISKRQQIIIDSNLAQTVHDCGQFGDKNLFERLEPESGPFKSCQCCGLFALDGLELIHFHSDEKARKWNQESKIDSTQLPQTQYKTVSLTRVRLRFKTIAWGCPQRPLLSALTWLDRVLYFEAITQNISDSICRIWTTSFIQVWTGSFGLNVHHSTKIVNWSWW
jgi:hypothetical protein